MDNILIIIRRELNAYFSTPMAFIFIAIFVAMTGAFTFYIGRFFIYLIEFVRFPPVSILPVWIFCLQVTFFYVGLENLRLSVRCLYVFPFLNARFQLL